MTDTTAALGARRSPFLGSSFLGSSFLGSSFLRSSFLRSSFLHSSFLHSFVSFLLFLPSPGQAQQQPASGGPLRWERVWGDEFDVDGLPDTARWSYDVGGHGWGNQELQFYTDRRHENARVEGGRLVIEARREPWEGQAYTSARLVTKGKGDWTYGRIEVRAKLPAGRGSWPAIWMLPTTTAPMRWPDDGEIDIMEHVGFDPGVVHGSVHTKRYHHSIGTQKTGRIAVPDASAAFHNYVIEWSPDQITWFVDGREFYRFEKEPGGTDVWPFDGPFHLVLNVAVGGSWGGQQGVDESNLPYVMEVDYVRVSRRATGAP